MLRRRVATVLVVLVALALASFLWAQDAAAPITLEFDGVVQSVNQTAVAINGQLVDISAAPIQTPLTAGAVVRVRAVVLPDGLLRAERIDPVPVGVPPGIVEFRGNISFIDALTLTLGVQSFDLTAADVDDELGLGEAVRIFARATVPGVWQALDVDRVSSLNAPAATPEVGNAPLPPAATPEVSGVNPPVSTQEVDDDNSGQGRGRGRGGDDDNDDDG